MSLVFVDNDERPTKFTFGLLGPTGVGKTHFLGGVSMIPWLAPVLFVTFDDSDDTITGPNYLANFIDKKTGVPPPPRQQQIVRIESVADLNQLLNEIRDDKDDRGIRRTPKLTYQGLKFKTVILDNLTILQKRHFAFIKDSQNKTSLSDQTPEGTDYRTSQDGIMKLLIKLRFDFSYNLIISAGDRLLTKGLDRTPIQYIPDLSSGLAEDIPSLFIHVGYLRWVGGKRVLDFRPNCTDPEFLALRDRLTMIYSNEKVPRLGILTDNPRFSDVWAWLADYYDPVAAEDLDDSETTPTTE